MKKNVTQKLSKIAQSDHTVYKLSLGRSGIATNLYKYDILNLTKMTDCLNQNYQIWSKFIIYKITMIKDSLSI